MREFDAIVIGTGQAGPSLAARLAGTGRKVAIIERKLFGGTCVNTGCIPTKTMVASAYAAHMARRAGDFGVSIEGKVTVDMTRVKARKDEISGESRKGVEGWMKGLENGTVYQGHARFVAPHQVQVNEETLRAEQIFINAGARAIVPPLHGIDASRCLTNSSMMAVDFLPRHLAIVGGSYIGLEFGQMFRRFGSEVTIIEKGPRLIQREDEDISAEILQIMEREGVHVNLDAECIGFEPDGDDVLVHAKCASGGAAARASHVLLAVGRRPNTDDLGLEQAGIEADSNGYIQVDDELRTSVPGVWALGDCNGKGGFTHTSYNDFEIVAANLLDGGRRRVSDRITAYALYIDPPLGRAGMTEREARSATKHLLIGRREMTRVGRAREKGETQGFMKIFVDGDTERILGAAILGTGGDEVIHSILDVMYAQAPYTTITHAMHIHPTVSELVPTMLEELKPAMV
jgi:pyruvate/2-oxoglutarate dehydrogenase complex dihydrolipoamide dehydrogenase (E3) component